ncbi:hypothetical protein E3N88_34702 [Mikania micrantha]|uniref:Uncharacterized protein n=1 Tax=Mikania micrantha TaxID=192012 RepID=A0A5N6LZ90_9ASTR|nr:hypothetical protein E3N88_34702 [Mikania micrantha]
MMNVGENRARNGVTDCPESRNEENFQSIELLDSSRSRRNIRHSTEVEEEHKTLDRCRGGTVVLSTTVEQNLSTAVKGAAFAYDD